MSLIRFVRKNSLVIILFFAIAFVFSSFSFKEGQKVKKRERSEEEKQADEKKRNEMAAAISDAYAKERKKLNVPISAAGMAAGIIKRNQTRCGRDVC